MAWQPSIPRWRSPRLAAAMAVVLVHAILVAVILSSQPGLIAQPRLRHEVFFLFPPPIKPLRLPRKIEPAEAKRSAPLFRYAPSTAITPPPPPADTLELSLFRCAPENLANLAPAERAHCDDAYTARAFESPLPGTVREQAADAARWQAAMLARNTPLSVPCVGMAKRDTDRIAQKTETAFQVDALCALRQLTDAPDR